MQNFKQAFLEFLIQQGVLEFGDFTLKSGRQSPYFFNAGLFNTGQGIGKLGRFYAQAIVDADLKFNVLFGPAYKGITLAVATAIALAEQHGKNVPFVYNRKEAKSYAEGGSIVGGPLKGRVLIIDDVITAGTAVKAAVQQIRAAGAEPAGVIISLDRQERGSGAESAIDEVKHHIGIPVHCIAKLDDLMLYMEEREDLASHVEAMRNYQREHGIAEAVKL
ncbi:MAG: orotate phosphoribosyltransferase [Gammaproteobacteria bacterium]|nr:orotate phosphoribosyltransferase [Gammaproteobacteria bacterium]